MSETPADFSHLEKRSPFQDLVDWRMTRWDETGAELVIEARPALRNAGGILHGGVLATLLDTVCGYAALGVPVGGNRFPDAADGPPRPRGVTLSMTVNYHGMVRDGLVRVVGTRTGGGKTVGFARAEAFDASGALVADATAIYRRLSPPPEPAGG